MGSTMRTIGRVFSLDQVLDHKALNVMGAQVFRAVAARGMYNMRRVPVPDIVADEFAELRLEGIVGFHNFLPPDHFNRVRAEVEWLKQQLGLARKFDRGTATVNRLDVVNLSHGELPAIREFCEDRRLVAILTAADQWPLHDLFDQVQLEHIMQNDAEDVDMTTQLHSDTFFNTHKAWFYLDDVRMEDGPLVYVKRSHRLTLERLSFHYVHSWKIYPTDTRARRISREELGHLKETAMACPKNTLIVANTHGFHRRGQGKPGGERTALHLDIRINPFAPHGLALKLARHPGVHGLLRRVKKMRPGRS